MADNIVRVEKNADARYVMIDKRLTENDSLSYAARGMMAYLLSKPDGWQVRMTDLENSGSEGRDRVRGIIEELAHAGYVKREYSRDKQGHWACSTTVYEFPLPVDQRRESTDGHPSTESRLRSTADGEPSDIVSNQSASTQVESDGVPSRRAVSGSGGRRPVKRQPSPLENERNAMRTALREYFVSRTKLRLPTDETARGIAELWWNPLRKICELAGWNRKQAEALVDAAIVKLDGLTIKAPKSILGTVESIVAERERKMTPTANVGGVLVMPVGGNRGRQQTA